MNSVFMSVCVSSSSSLFLRFCFFWVCCWCMLSRRIISNLHHKKALLLSKVPSYILIKIIRQGMTDIFAQEFQSLLFFFTEEATKNQQKRKIIIHKNLKICWRFILKTDLKRSRKQNKEENVENKGFFCVFYFLIINCQQIPCDFSFIWYLRRNAINNDG